MMLRPSDITLVKILPIPLKYFFFIFIVRMMFIVLRLVITAIIISSAIPSRWNVKIILIVISFGLLLNDIFSGGYIIPD